MRRGASARAVCTATASVWVCGCVGAWEMWRPRLAEDDSKPRAYKAVLVPIEDSRLPPSPAAPPARGGASGAAPPRSGAAPAAPRPRPHSSIYTQHVCRVRAETHTRRGERPPAVLPGREGVIHVYTHTRITVRGPGGAGPGRGPGPRAGARGVSIYLVFGNYIYQFSMQLIARPHQPCHYTRHILIQPSLMTVPSPHHEN